jgi:hypothetical protein
MPVAFHSISASPGCQLRRSPSAATLTFFTIRWGKWIIYGLIFDTGTLRTVSLPRKISVHLIYMTVGADAEGRVLFWPDVYQRDPALDRALHKSFPRDS